MPFIMPSQETFPTAPEWDVSNPTGPVIKAIPAGADAWYWTPDGDYMYTLEDFRSILLVYRYPVSTPFDVLSIGTYDQTLHVDPTVIAYDDTPESMTFSPDGIYLYLSDRENPSFIHRWTMSTPWDLTTAVVGTKANMHAFGAPISTGLHMSADGLSLGEVAGSTGEVHIHTLNTPFFLPNGTNVTSTFTVGYAPDKSLYFDEFGTQFVLARKINNNSYDINVYKTAVPWDISSAFLFSTVNVGVPISEVLAEGCIVTPDGTRMMLFGASQRRIYQYDL